MTRLICHSEPRFQKEVYYILLLCWVLKKIISINK